MYKKQKTKFKEICLECDDGFISANQIKREVFGGDAKMTFDISMFKIN